MSLTVSAPAKVNLWLRILGRRADGYHDLDTRMVTTTLADELTLTLLDAPTGTVRFTCSDESLPVDDSNLVVKALSALAEAAGPLPAVSIHLEKVVPHGAGLGGGSSDAAAALTAANALLHLGLPPDRLAEIAASIGSDVPFFLDGGAADCRGRGEIVVPVPDFRPRLPILLIKPPFPVPTPWAYQQWRESEEIAGISYAPQPFPWGSLVNDLERPVFAKHLVLADLKMWLLQRPEVAGALMSGSGSTTFALLRDDAPASDLIAAVKAEYGADVWIWQGHTA